MPLTTVRVPKELAARFEQAEAYVARYFEGKREDPTRGTIKIGGERYVLMRASSVTVNFLKFVRTLYPDLAREEAFDASASILFDLAHGIGKADATAFHLAMKVTDPIDKLSSGPVHFAYTGWAFVDISAESNPVPGEEYYLLYDHPNSFESDAWLASGENPGRCVCTMNAGYSSGWCEASFDMILSAQEILCRADGDDCCRFIMAPPSRLNERVAAYRASHPDLFKS